MGHTEGLCCHYSPAFPQMRYSMIKQVECHHCDGNYVVRDGQYGIFAGCSEYPRCKSTLKVHELAHAFIMKYGLNLYGWKKPCWKCKQDITVYSYFLYYELEEIDNIFCGLHGIGLGDIPCVDHIISNKYKTITKRYSNTTQSRYMANTCEHCQALQGRNFIVDDPHEIIVDLWHDHTMERYLVENLKISSPNLLAELKECLDLS